MESLWQELRFALRGLTKSKTFTAVAVASLALGIGANTAMFTLLDQALLRRLPVKEPHRIVLVRMDGHYYGSTWGSSLAISYPLYQDLRDNNQVFEGMFCRFPTRASLGFGDRTERVSAELVSSGYFQVLGVGTALGRGLLPEDNHAPGGRPVVVLAHDYWQSRFAADPSIVGRTVAVNGHKLTVVGVTAAGFHGVQLEYVPQIYVPMAMQPQMMPGWDFLEDRRTRFVNAFGRLESGRTLAQAQASLQPFVEGVLRTEVEESSFSRASAEDREAYLKMTVDVRPAGQGPSYLRRQLETPLVLLMGLTAGVLLIACANVANLLIARAAVRSQEIAIRLALGASRVQIARQLLVEGLLLAGLGAAAGVALAYATNQMVFAMMPPYIANLKLSPAPDLRILGFTIAVAATAALVFGLAPAVQSARAQLAPALKDQAGALAGGKKQAHFRKALVTAQVAISVLLLVGAGLFVRSLMNLRELGPGFETQNLLAFNVDPSTGSYTLEESKAFHTRFGEELRSLPGVSAVGQAAVGILQDSSWDTSITVEGHVPGPDGSLNAYMNSVSPGYFEALGVSVVAGRDFTLQDTEQVKHREDDDDSWVPRVVVVNESFARHYFGDASPLGRHIGFGDDPGTRADMEIVGVVGDIKYRNLRDEIPIQAFIPYLASTRVGDMTYYVRTSLAPETAVSQARERLRTLDPNLPLYGVRTLEQRLSDSLLIERLIAGLSAAFGLLATLLASVGLYGVLAYNVTRRTREIGLRLALGALSRDMLWLVLREALVLLGIGLVVGLPAALGLAHYARAQLFGVSFADPVSLGLAILGLGLAATLAGLIPARRASRLDPTQALRHE
ncbi:MAG: ABC transporter permease [Acidobacteria bacterium]|nr:ABC transporter permease [Acidobacteriota bacterium]